VGVFARKDDANVLLSDLLWRQANSVIPLYSFQVMDDEFSETFGAVSYLEKIEVAAMHSPYSGPIAEDVVAERCLILGHEVNPLQAVRAKHHRPFIQLVLV
jgi:hypothetical protein